MSERAGWLYKQSGGKSKRGNSVGNLVAKWDRRYFVLTGGMLRYYKARSGTRKWGAMRLPGELRADD